MLSRNADEISLNVLNNKNPGGNARFAFPTFPVLFQSNQLTDIGVV